MQTCKTVLIEFMWIVSFESRWSITTLVHGISPAYGKTIAPAP